MIELLITLTILANSQRVHPLMPDVELSKHAQTRAEALCKANQWSHDNWLDSFKGVNYTYAGENLAKGFSTVESMQAAWMNSPTHKANIVNSHYTNLGVGSACGIVVELFRG